MVFKAGITAGVGNGSAVVGTFFHRAGSSLSKPLEKQMTMGSKLAEELPYLRRYARAVTGSQALGDAAVRAMLEAILESPDEFDATLPARLAIYRIFHRSWRPIDEATSENGQLLCWTRRNAMP